MIFSRAAQRQFATRVGVIGAGQMGTGIGIVSSRVAKYEVVFVDPMPAGLKKSETFVQNWCKKEIEKERLTDAEMKDVLARIQWTSDIQSLKDCDLVIEAANENFDLKKRIFMDAAKVVKDKSILASNTSSISISKIAGTIPDRAH